MHSVEDEWSALSGRILFYADYTVLHAHYTVRGGKQAVEPD